MQKFYVYKGETYHSAYAVKKAIEKAENKRFWAEPKDATLEEKQSFWKEFSVEYREEPDPVPPEPTLEELKRLGYRLAVASSSPLEHIEKVLEECGIAGFFEAVESGDELTQSKPNPEIYLLTLGKLGLPAEACCAVEDSDPGIEAARRAGLYTIAKREERFGFTQRGADIMVNEIPGVIGAVLEYAPA